ncbi:MAG: hypothetical protein RQ741_07640 [Wenzhouxiangellaceae bacterium]|nr:hypothetical protein [Wenzhouxiangellaceae bacterium]
MTVVIFAAALQAGPAIAADGIDQFVRVARDPGGEPRALEIAIARYGDANGTIVDLVGAVHVADRDYFKALDRRFADYDAVLYELVGEPDAMVSGAGASTSMIGLLQGGMKDALGLSFQLDEIDYRQPNLVHADLTGPEFSASMASRGESLAGLMFKAWAATLADSGNPAGQQGSLLKLLFAQDRQLALKRLFAAQLADQMRLLDSLSSGQGSTLITVRNQRALEELSAQIKRGHDKLAIFYGAGHMPDLAGRLEAEFGMRHQSTGWLQAWDLRGSGVID